MKKKQSGATLVNIVVGVLLGGIFAGICWQITQTTMSQKERTVSRETNILNIILAGQAVVRTGRVSKSCTRISGLELRCTLDFDESRTDVEVQYLHVPDDSKIIYSEMKSGAFVPVREFSGIQTAEFCDPACLFFPTDLANPANPNFFRFRFMGNSTEKDPPFIVQSAFYARPELSNGFAYQWLK